MLMKSDIGVAAVLYGLYDWNLNKCEVVVAAIYIGDMCWGDQGDRALRGVFEPSFHGVSAT